MIETRITPPAPRALWLVPAPPPEDQVSLDERRFATLASAFRPHGGLMSSETVVECLRWKAPQPASTLARWIASRDIVTLVRHGRTLIPMFQLQLADLSIRPAFTRVFHELRDTFDDDEVALWFASPNSWLGTLTPLDCLADQACVVAEAARADRFIARG